MPSRLRSWGLGLALFAGVAAAYVASPGRDLLDAKYALLTSEALLRDASWDLAPYLPELVARMRDPSHPPWRVWQVIPVEERLLYFYPPGAPLFSAVPFALLRLGGATTLDAGGHYDGARELALQSLVAGLVGAAAVLLGFALARRELPLGPALGVALVAAFGSGYWSVVSRGLWSHSWTVVMLSAALLELVRWEDGERPRPVVLGALLAAAFWARPTNAFAAVVFTAAVALRHRSAVPRLIATGAAGVVAYLAWSRLVWGSWLPANAKHLVPKGDLDPPAALLGQLVSAEHGLLVFSPVLLAVAWGLVRHGVAREHRGAAGVSLALVAIYLAFHAWRARWWGAGAVGPRFLCDLTPFLLWLGAHAWKRASERRRGGRLGRALAAGAVAALALASVAAHATGAFRIRPSELARSPGDRHGDEIAPLGSVRYWRRLPQVALASYVARLVSAEAAPPETGRSRRERLRQRGG